MSGQLTTHVLDTAHGCPANDLAIALWSLNLQNGTRELLKQVTTNADGRTESPLLRDGALQTGSYELIFSIGAYFRRLDPNLPELLFLDQVPIRFGIADATAHYHVPLLASPWSYSTYRGS